MALGHSVCAPSFAGKTEGCTADMTGKLYDRGEMTVYSVTCVSAGKEEPKTFQDALAMYLEQVSGCVLSSCHHLLSHPPKFDCDTHKLQ